MSTDERLQLLLNELLDAGAPSRAPDRLVHETLRAMREVRRWPRWLAFLKEPPMRVSSGVAVGSPTSRVLATIALTLLLALVATGAVVGATTLLAGPTVLVVAQDGSGTHVRIVDAVAAAEDGDTVLVRPGHYTEAVAVYEDIAIKGDGPRAEIVISAPEHGPTVFIERDGTERDPYAVLLDGTDATLSGLTLRGEASEVVASGGSPTLEDLVFERTGIPNAGKRSVTNNSIVINGGSAATVRGSVLTGGGAIGVFDGSSPTIEGNTLTGGPHLMGRDMGDGTVFRGNTVADAIVHAIGVHEGNGTVTIDGNVITNPRSSGIDVWESTGVRITGNTVSGADGYGILADATADALVEGNRVSDSGIAISVKRGSVRLNELSGNGIGVVPGGTTDVAGNQIRGGVTGVSATTGAPTITGNTITGNEQGLVIGIGITPVLSGNDICGNTRDLIVPEGVEPPDTSGNEICADVAEEQAS